MSREIGARGVVRVGRRAFAVRMPAILTHRDERAAKLIRLRLRLDTLGDPRPIDTALLRWMARETAALAFDSASLHVLEARAVPAKNSVFQVGKEEVF